MVPKVGDSVIVMPGTDDDTTRAANHKSKKATSTNTLGNTMWCVYFLISDQDFL